MIPRADGLTATTFPKGNTADIMTEVLSTYEASKQQLSSLAPYLKAVRLEDTCRTVWQLVKHHIAYKMDPAGEQWVKTPARLWADKVGDCKSYSVFIAACLYHLGIKGTFRFVSFSSSQIPTHVYIVVKNNGKEIILDAVLNRFDIEKPFTHKFDYNMTRISRLSGIGNPPEITIDDLTLKIIKERMQLEQQIAGIGSTSSEKVFYDTWIREIDGMLAVAPNAAVTGFFSNVGKFFSNAAKAVVNVVTFPVTLAAKAILEVALPSAGMGFLYLFITKPEIVATLPAAVKSKREKQEKLKNFIIDVVNMKNDHFMGIVRNGIMKKVGMSPENYLSSQLKRAISGIGSADLLQLAPQAGTNAQKTMGGFLDGIKELIKKIASLFGKKAPVDAEDAAPAAADWEKWFDGATALAPDVQNIVDQIKNTTANQTAPKSTGTNIPDNINPPSPKDDKDKKDNTMLYLGGGALLLVLLTKK